MTAESGRCPPHPVEQGGGKGLTSPSPGLVVSHVASMTPTLTRLHLRARPVPAVGGTQR